MEAIYKNLQILNRSEVGNFTKEDIYKGANYRPGWYRKGNGNVVNFLLTPKRLETSDKKMKRQETLFHMDLTSCSLLC